MGWVQHMFEDIANKSVALPTVSTKRCEFWATPFRLNNSVRIQSITDFNRSNSEQFLSKFDIWFYGKSSSCTVPFQLRQIRNIIFFFRKQTGFLEWLTMAHFVFHSHCYKLSIFYLLGSFFTFFLLEQRIADEKVVHSFFPLYCVARKNRNDSRINMFSNALQRSNEMYDLFHRFAHHSRFPD